MNLKPISLLKNRLQSIRRYFIENRFNTTSAPNPKVIYLAVTGVCNLKCKMCDVGQKHRDSQFYKIMNPVEGVELSLQRLEDMVKEVKYFKPLIAVTSTEPLLYKDLFPFCDFVVSNGLEVQITTNGFLLSRLAEDIVKVGINSLWVSLDGPPDVHNLIRGVNHSFERAYEGIREVSAYKKRFGKKFPAIYINYTITNYNYHCLDKFMEAIKGLEIEMVGFSHMNYVTNTMAEKHNRLFGNLYPATSSSIAAANPELVDIKTLAEQVKKIKKLYFHKSSFSPDLDEKGIMVHYFKPGEFVKGKRCLVPWQAAEIIANGDCVVMTRCFNISLGNIYKTDFMKIWNGKEYRDFRKNLLKYGSFPACTRCCGIL